MPFHRTACTALAVSFPFVALAQSLPTVVDDVEVTATRTPEPVSRVPASISVVHGEELRARGANDLRTALSLVAGVEGTPGGDSGPAGAVPALWGLREQDAYLLVVDGVPWGGAFNPATPSLDLSDVERIEVLRGAAPVMFGATSFVGVIHVIHYRPGETPGTVRVGGGSYGSVGGSGTVSLPAIGGWQHALSANVEKRGYSVDRQEYERYHLFYRGATEVLGGRFHLDTDLSDLPQTPGNVAIRSGSALRSDLPLDANHNPADAKLDQQRLHLATGLDFDTHFGQWTTTVAYTRTLDDIVRGFLRDYAPLTGMEAGDPDKPDAFDADGYAQKRQITDVYVDSHLTSPLTQTLQLTVGADYLYGRGRQHANNFGYFVKLDGSGAPSSGQQHVDELVRSEDKRSFAGLYAQTDWKPVSRVDLIAGLRLNRTSESAQGQEIANDADQMEAGPPLADHRGKTRLSGVVGASWRVAERGANSLTLFADYRNSYKPLAVDFGPEAEVALLEPETADSYEAGFKGRALNGRYEYEASVFRLNMKNALTFDQGAPINGGRQRFQGVEYEGRYALHRDLKLALNYAYHDARFKQLRLDDGTDVSGKRLEMSPYQLYGAGLMWQPRQGCNGALAWNYIGGRALNKRNTAQAGGYSTFDASLGYRLGRYGLQLNGYNLSDRRVPVSESELADSVSGASSYYLLPARTVLVNLYADL
jgi:outer membrane receptor protein involved in Fe transport